MKKRIELFSELNLFRISNAKRKLSYSELIEQEAQFHAEEMSRTGSKNHGFLKNSRCEIIAWDCNDVSDAIGWWINQSVSHRDAILGDFSEVGIGVADKGVFVCRFK